MMNSPLVITVAVAIVCSLCTSSSGGGSSSSSMVVEGFTTSPSRTTTIVPATNANRFMSPQQQLHLIHENNRPAAPAQVLSPTALNVWWFGGNDNTSSELNEDGDSCELVAVRIERTSANSRKIAGSITVGTPLSDVWAILTDYDRLAIHVPNLVESRIVSKQSTRGGEMGDGSFRCKLFQKGAQKIVGFEFGASVTMDMTERIIQPATTTVNDKSGGADAHSSAAAGITQQERVIGFKCVDSFFFSEFDGEWRAKEQVNADGEVETVLDYVVDVRPKGPVPVAALEWRIREDVPTNLRAVKKAAQEVGLEGVLASRQRITAPTRKRRDATRVVPVAPKMSRPTVTAATATASSKSTREKEQRYRQPQLQNTNAIRRATVRGPRLANPLLRRRGQAATVMASTKETLANNRAQRAASQKATEKAPLPFKVIWEQDETMAAYLAE